MTKREEWRAISRSMLEGLYRNHSGPEIADMYGVSVGAVNYRLKFFQLTAKSNGSKRTRGPAKSFMPNKEELAEMYSRMSMRDVAKNYGVSETVVFHRLRDYGIQIATRSERLSGKKKTLAHRLKLSESRRGNQVGSENPNWKGGISSKGKLARSKAEYFEWKAAVLSRANYRCEECGLEHGHICAHCGHRVYLHAHHLKPFAKFPELRYEVTNGKSLCDRCHQAEHDKKIA